MKKKYQRNILLFYLLSIFSGLAFVYDLILVIYYKSFGLSFSQISLIAIVVSAFVLMFEVPSGAYADMYGKKRSLLVSVSAFVLSFLIIILSNSFILFLVAAAIFGLYLAFYSGSYNALLYDSLKECGRKKDYLKINSRVEAIFLITTLITVFMGPYLYSFNKLIPLYVTLVFGLLSLIVVLLLYDSMKIKRHSNFIKKHIKQIREGFVFSVRHSKILWLIVFTSLIAFIEGAFSSVLEVPYLLDLGFIIKQVAVIEFVSLIVQILFVWKASYVEKKFGENYSLLFVVLLASIPLFLTRFIGNYSIGVVMGLFWGGLQFSGLVTDNYLNHHLNKKNRATVISINSMVSSVVLIVLLPLLGLIIDSISTVFSVGLLSCIVFIFGLILLIIKSRIFD